MLEKIKIRLLYTSYYPNIMRTRNSDGQRIRKSNNRKLHTIKLCIKVWESSNNSFWKHDVKLRSLRIRNTRLTDEYLMSKKRSKRNMQKCRMQTQEADD